MSQSAQATSAWVSLVMLFDGTPAVLKIAKLHFESEHEITGLRFWDRNPTVRLLEGDENVGALLLERCEPVAALCALQPEAEQDDSGIPSTRSRTGPPNRRTRCGDCLE